MEEKKRIRYLRYFVFYSLIALWVGKGNPKASGETINKPAEGNRKPLLYFPLNIMTQHISTNLMNDINEGSRGAISSSREVHVLQGNPDHQQVTVCKNKDIMKIVTWNMRTLLQKRKQLNIKGLCEVRWTGGKDFGKT